MIKITSEGARFMRNGYRFVVKPDGNVMVYERVGNSDYSLNYPASKNRAAYDAKRYQINKNKEVITAIQTILNY